MWWHECLPAALHCLRLLTCPQHAWEQERLLTDESYACCLGLLALTFGVPTRLSSWCDWLLFLRCSELWQPLTDSPLLICHLSAFPATPCKVYRPLALCCSVQTGIYTEPILWTFIQSKVVRRLMKPYRLGAIAQSIRAAYKICGKAGWLRLHMILFNAERIVNVSVVLCCPIHKEAIFPGCQVRPKKRVDVKAGIKDCRPQYLCILLMLWIWLQS